MHCITNSMCFAEKRTCPFLFAKKVLSKNLYAVLHNDLSEMCSILFSKTLSCQAEDLWFKPQRCYFYDLRTTFPLWQEKKYFFHFCVGHPRMRGAPVNPPLFRPPPPSNTSLPPPPTLSFVSVWGGGSMEPFSGPPSPQKSHTPAPLLPQKQRHCTIGPFFSVAVQLNKAYPCVRVSCFRL